MSLHPTQTVDIRDVVRHTSSWVWSAVLTQCEKDSPSSMGSSMTWCPLICRQTRFHQKDSESASAATNLHHPSFLAERDDDTAWCAPTHTGLKLILQIKLVTCQKNKQKNTKLLSPFNWGGTGGSMESILLSTSSCPALLLPTYSPSLLSFYPNPQPLQKQHVWLALGIWCLLGLQSAFSISMTNWGPALSGPLER